jgi:hypothetical protein
VAAVAEILDDESSHVGLFNDEKVHTAG